MPQAAQYLEAAWAYPRRPADQAGLSVKDFALKRGLRPFALEQWVAYIGLDVGIRESGKRKGERGLTKQGDAELRRLFYLCAKSTVTRPTSPFAAQYQRELKKGMKKTAALCAVARKLAKVVWALFEHGGRYEPSRVYAASPA